MCLWFIYYVVMCRGLTFLDKTEIYLKGEKKKNTHTKKPLQYVDAISALKP